MQKVELLQASNFNHILRGRQSCTKNNKYPEYYLLLLMKSLRGINALKKRQYVVRHDNNQAPYTRIIQVRSRTHIQLWYGYRRVAL